MYNIAVRKGFKRAKAELPTLIERAQIKKEDLEQLLGVRIRRRGIFISGPFENSLTASLFNYTIGLDFPYEWFSGELKENLRKVEGVANLRYGPEDEKITDLDYANVNRRHFIHVEFSLDHSMLRKKADDKLSEINRNGKVREEYQKYKASTGGQLFLGYMEESVYGHVRQGIETLLEIGKTEIERRLSLK